MGFINLSFYRFDFEKSDFNTLKSLPHRLLIKITKSKKHILSERLMHHDDMDK